MPVSHFPCSFQHHGGGLKSSPSTVNLKESFLQYVSSSTLNKVEFVPRVTPANIQIQPPSQAIIKVHIMNNKCIVIIPQWTY